MFLDADLDIGITTKFMLNRLFNGGDITEVQKRRFFKGVRKFYENSYDYALNNLPLNDPLLVNSQFINWKTRREYDGMEEIEYFVNRYV